MSAGTVKVLTNRAPSFLKAVYPLTHVKLVDHVGFVDGGERFIIWTDGAWTVHKMTTRRVPQFVASYRTAIDAVFMARR